MLLKMAKRTYSADIKWHVNRLTNTYMSDDMPNGGNVKLLKSISSI